MVSLDDSDPKKHKAASHRAHDTYAGKFKSQSQITRIVWSPNSNSFYTVRNCAVEIAMYMMNAGGVVGRLVSMQRAFEQPHLT